MFCTLTVDTFIDSLVNSFIVTKIDTNYGSFAVEVIRINHVETIHGLYTYHKIPKVKNELTLKVEARCYSLTDSDSIKKYNTDLLILDTDTIEIIPVTNDNITSLLIDANKLIRSAAKEWYSNTDFAI